MFPGIFAEKSPWAIHKSSSNYVDSLPMKISVVGINPPIMLYIYEN